MALKLANLPIGWGDEEENYVAVIRYGKCDECKKDNVPSVSFGVDGGHPIITICKQCILKYFDEFEIAN
jgi:hypothetical protein